MANRIPKRSNDSVAANEPGPSKRRSFGRAAVDYPPPFVFEDQLRYTEICEVGDCTATSFDYCHKVYTLRLKEEIVRDPPPGWDWITMAINDMVKYAKCHMRSQLFDERALIIENHNFNQPISTGFDWTNDTVAKLVGMVEQNISSDVTIRLEDCVFTIVIVRIPYGEGHKKLTNLAEDRLSKRSILQMRNKDNLCGPRAIITGLSMVTDTIMGQKLNANERAQVRKGGGKIQTQLAKQLCELIGWCHTFRERKFTIAEIKACEAALDIQVKVISAQSMNNVIYKGQIDKPTRVYLYKSGYHFDAISRLNAFFGTAYYCHQCDTPYHHKDEHRCETVRKKKSVNPCLLCMGLKHPSDTADPIYCNNCNRYCYNAVCRTAHTRYVCRDMTCCNRCPKVMKRKNVQFHKCGIERCTNCGWKVEISTHQCYMQPLRAKGGRCPKCSGCNTTSCSLCTYTERYIFFFYDASMPESDATHHPKLVVARYFDGTEKSFTSTDQFCQWLISPVHARYTAIGYYAGGKNSQTILQYMITNTINPNIVCTGTKLTMLEAEDLQLRIIDSRNFTQPSLNTLTTAITDVDSLRRMFLELRYQFLQLANIDPLRYLTLPSACMVMYRSKYMSKDTIAIIQPNYDCYSKSAMAWLDSLQNNSIDHALNGGEEVICGAPVDGYDPQTRTVYLFHGCYTHGCPRCFNEDRINKASRETMQDLYLKTKHRTENLRAANYEVVEKWECDWKSNSFSSKWEREYNHLQSASIDPRDALYGNRTEVFKLKTKCHKPEPTAAQEKEIDYLRKQNVYVSAMLSHPYPVGHPTIILLPSEYDPEWFGIVKCQILPPRRLYIPVLPVRVERQNAQKIVFPLCNSCAVNKSQVCSHTDDERMLEGTWTTIEVEEAIRQGYRILKVHEVWHFEKSNELWGKYARDLLELKLRSSPHMFPTNEAYVAEIKLKFDIELDIDQITPNPSERAFADLCLNSLWGEFDQCDDQTRNEFIKDTWRLYNILLDKSLENVDISCVNEKMLLALYNKKDKCIENESNTNIMIPIYTTAIVRLELYQVLSKVERDIVYCDTDSIVLQRSSDESYPILLGGLPGEWSNELSGDDSIQTWLATGPRSYSFQTQNGERVTKVRGFILPSKNAEVVNAEAMEKSIDDEVGNMKKALKKPVETSKFEFDYRVIVDDYGTRPYGFCI